MQERAYEGRDVPRFIRQEFEGFLRCGILASLAVAGELRLTRRVFPQLQVSFVDALQGPGLLPDVRRTKDGRSGSESG